MERVERGERIRIEYFEFFTFLYSIHIFPPTFRAIFIRDISVDVFEDIDLIFSSD